MTGSSGLDDDMLNSPWPTRTDVPPAGDAALDALLAPGQQPQDTIAALRPVAEVLAALRAAPGHGELAGFDQALNAFRSGAGLTEPVRRPRHRSARPARRDPLLRARLAAAAAIAAVAALGAASYAGVLPAALQKFAHRTIGAPAAKAGSSPQPGHLAGTAAGPIPGSPAAHGLCAAYQHAQEHGTATQRSTAFRRLAEAAGGASKVVSYCAVTTHPGAAHASQGTGHAGGHPSQAPSAPGKAKGKPTGHPNGKPADHPIGKPTDLPTWKPAGPPIGTPAGYPNGKSTHHPNGVSRR